MAEGKLTPDIYEVGAAPGTMNEYLITAGVFINVAEIEAFLQSLQGKTADEVHRLLQESIHAKLAK